ncbi:MAG TPA: ABC transporter permease [Stackebrandtia sp.]|uniref:ABC transporter permease n=1 Tax=Stackebrandtia sp. TaxID=2023065 RepID=UPI002D52B5B6|nr:ABC transporter permease [Stackebrandtia sp.]HZE37420.1 ABC transporter permease [Stackebrandtia sp.]
MRARVPAYLASGCVIAAGTALLSAFATLFATSVTADAPDDRTLRTMAVVLGGWTSVLVIFAVATTVGLTVQHRERELALLRAIGGTPGQVRRGVVCEAVAVAVPTMVLGGLSGIGLGSFVWHWLVDGGVISKSSKLDVDWRMVAVAVAVTLLATCAGAWFAGRRAAAIAPMRALAETREAPGGRALNGLRLIGGLAATSAGVGMAVTTLYMPNGMYLSATAGPACVWAAIGLSLLSPAFIAPLAAVLRALPVAGARLAGRNLAARPRAVAAVVAPLSLLVGITCGTLYMQGTENSVIAKIPGSTDGLETIKEVNYIVVTMIIAFCAISVLNTLIASTRRRRQEFGLLRLVGAQRRQLLIMVFAEAVACVLLSVLLGTLAAAATVVPYSLVRIDSALPKGSAGIYPAVLGGAVLLSLVAALPTALRNLTERPVAAVAA